MLKCLICLRSFSLDLQNGWEDSFATCHNKAGKGSGAMVTSQSDLYIL